MNERRKKSPTNNELNNKTYELGFLAKQQLFTIPETHIRKQNRNSKFQVDVKPGYKST